MFTHFTRLVVEKCTIQLLSSNFQNPIKSHEREDEKKSMHASNTETIRKAVIQLYFPSSSCDAHAREEANHYINSFTAEQSSSIPICISLLDESLHVLSSSMHEEQDGSNGKNRRTERTIAFFAANALKTKVLKENIISVEDIEEFITKMLNFANEFATTDEDSFAVARKLASVAATSAALAVKQQYQHRDGNKEEVGIGIATNLIRFAGEITSSALLTTANNNGDRLIITNTRKQTCGIEILKAFAEAIEEDVKDGRTRTQLVERVCKPSGRDVLQLCSSVLLAVHQSADTIDNREMKSAATNAVGACLECSGLWFEACSKESDSTSYQSYQQLFSPCDVSEAYPDLFSNAAMFLSSLDDKRGETALQFLVKMCSGGQSTDYARERFGNLELMRLLIHYATVCENKPCFTSWTVASRVLQVFVALVERDVLTFTEHMKDDANSNVQHQAIEFVCTLAEAFPKETVEPFGDFCLMINTIKKNERIEACRDHLFERLFNVCCIASASRKLSALKENDFSDESADDEEYDEDSAKLREHVLTDAFDTCHGALGGEKYLTIVSNLFHQNGNHQSKVVDVALFALIAAKYGIKEDISAANAHVVQFFMQIFTSIANNEALFVSHPRVIEMSCKLIDTYFPVTVMKQVTTPGDLILRTLRFSLLAMSLKKSWRAASVAFRDVCGKLETKIAHFQTETIVEIIQLATEAMDRIPTLVIGAPENDASKQQDEELSRACVEGLARVLRTMWVFCANDMVKYEVVKGVLMRLISPHIERLNRSVEQKNTILASNMSTISSESVEALQARSIEICLSLSRLGAMVRFLEPPPSLTPSSPPRSDLACLVLESAWSSIENIVSPSHRASGVMSVKNQAERDDEESVKALEVLSNFALSSKMRARDFSEHVFTLLESSLVPGSTASRHVMHCISAFLEAICEPMPPYDLECASHSTKASVVRCLERVLSSPDAYQLRQNGMYAKAFYEVARTAILFAPSISIDTNVSSSQVVYETLASSLNLLAAPSSNCGLGDRRMVLLSIASLWNTLMYPSERLLTSSTTWQRCHSIASNFAKRDQAQQIIAHCADAMFFQDECSCPRDCLRALAKMLRGALIEVDAGQEASLKNEKIDFFLSLFTTKRLVASNAPHVCVEILKRGELSAQRVDAMLVDFAYICRQEADTDALEDYLLL